MIKYFISRDEKFRGPIYKEIDGKYFNLRYDLDDNIIWSEEIISKIQLIETNLNEFLEGIKRDDPDDEEYIDKIKKLMKDDLYKEILDE